MSLDNTADPVEIEQTYSADVLSDVFSDSPPASPSHTAPDTLQLNEPSDIPRLRTTHTTSGYRDGIAASKTQSLQPGFDEGYSLGAVLGLRAGYILGVLEGIYISLHDDQPEKAKCRAILDQARQDLNLQRVFGREVWAEDGTWAYETEGSDGEMTFEEVADAHPLLRQWRTKLDELVQEWGVQIAKFEGEEWEKGRVDTEEKD
ncbi:Essential protein Yae1, N terminal [Lignoscripta atroalba]|nr:Essential protein Yae1, N terminal [Lignoscripta atroalba]